MFCKMHTIFFFLCIFSHYLSATSQALAAWRTRIGDNVIYQNATSGDLLYSIATGSGVGVGGFTAWAKLPVTTPPKPGSSLAGTGYIGADGSMYGQIFYISNSGGIVEAEVQCTMANVNCTLQRSNIISSEVTSGVNSNTGLAATLRSSTDGYRAFYHDDDGKVSQVRYNYPNITWGSRVSVISDTNQSIGGISTDSGANLTAYGIDAAGNILSSTLDSNENWLKSNSIPSHQLSSWDPSNVTLAATVDARNVSRSLFYIGTGRSIREIDTTDAWQTVNTASPQGSETFPLADQPNAKFAITSSSSSTCFYYISNGNIVQATLNSGVWQKAVPILGSSTASFVPPSWSRRRGERFKVVLGIVVGLGVIILAGLGILGCVLWRRRQSRHGSGVVEMVRIPPTPLATPPIPHTPPTPGPPVPEKNPFEISSREIILYELDGDEKVELAGRPPSWEPHDEKSAANRM